MSIFQGDIIIKTAIELGIEDMRENPWLLDHVFSDLTAINYFSSKYGQKQIDSCKEWFENNEVSVQMSGINERSKFPLVTIEMGNSPEKETMKTMGDSSTETTILLPNQIGKPIPYVIKPFLIQSYDPNTGIIETVDVIDFSGVGAGMILVDPTNGEGFTILDISPSGLIIEGGLQLTAYQLGIVPQNQYYTARVEHTFQQDTYIVRCHSLGDPQVVIWLHSIVLYSIYRYREALLEANGFAESSIISGPPSINIQFSDGAGQVGWTRQITLTGQVEQSWIKSPQRIIESVALREKDVNGGYVGGITIISNFDPIMDTTEDIWRTTDDDNGTPDFD